MMVQVSQWMALARAQEPERLAKRVDRIKLERGLKGPDSDREALGVLGLLGGAVDGYYGNWRLLK